LPAQLLLMKEPIRNLLSSVPNHPWHRDSIGAIIRFKMEGLDNAKSLTVKKVRITGKAPCCTTYNAEQEQLLPYLLYSLYRETF
jgi:hypothetical protein